MIAKGVRFNAVKKPKGKYHSTQIWVFIFKCEYCGNNIKVITDPENCDYKFLAGAKRIFRTDVARDGTVVDQRKVKPKETNEFTKLEKKMKNPNKIRTSLGQLQGMIEFNN